MKTKILLIVLFVVLMISGCGTSEKITKVNTDKYKSLTVPRDKALVYFVRPSVVGLIVPFKVHYNDSLIGSTTGGKYLFLAAEPGNCKFISVSENDAELNLSVEAGKQYFIEQKPKMGIVMARNDLILLTEEEGKIKLSKCSISTKFTPPDLK